MNASEKVIESVREWFITNDGYNFLRLSEKDQNNLIAAVIYGYIEKQKSE